MCTYTNNTKLHTWSLECRDLHIFVKSYCFASIDLRDIYCCVADLTVLSPVYTIQPVVKRLSNRFDNRFYRVKGVMQYRPNVCSSLSVVEWHYRRLHLQRFAGGQERSQKFVGGGYKFKWVKSPHNGLLGRGLTGWGADKLTLATASNRPESQRVLYILAAWRHWLQLVHTKFSGTDFGGIKPMYLRRYAAVGGRDLCSVTACVYTTPEVLFRRSYQNIVLLWISRWKNFENRLRFDGVTAMRLVVYFFGTQCICHLWQWSWRCFQHSSHFKKITDDDDDDNDTRGETASKSEA